MSDFFLIVWAKESQYVLDAKMERPYNDVKEVWWHSLEPVLYTDASDAQFYANHADSHYLTASHRQ